jgi:hypothetical protein
MMGTSGSEARLMVDSGDLRMLVEEVDRLTEETVEAARLGGRELKKLPSEDVAVGAGLAFRYDGEYGI